jgi:peptide/nickel transport system substrate-binding protein
MTRWPLVRWLSAILVVLSAACAAPPQGTGGEKAPAPSASPKVLRIGAQREPDSFLRPGSQGQERILDIAHAHLVVPTERAELVPRLAEEAPSLERGTWRLNPDGTMETVWRLRASAKWHDGRPMTADDLVFAFELHGNRSFAVSPPRPFRFMDSVAMVEAHTLSIRWKETYALATDSELLPYPRHILAPLVDDSLERFHNSPHWAGEFIGLGPYRLVKWESGSHMEFSRFDDHFLGRPKLDTVLYTFYPDVNALIANILSGAVDLHMPVVLDAQQALDVQRRWEGTGNRVLVGPDGRMEFIGAQLRPDSEVVVKPGALRDIRVRQALYRGLDRNELAQAVFFEYAKVADSWVPPDDPRRQVPVFRDAVVQYPYDPTRAQRELEEVGWPRGSDGIRVNAAGERFELELRHTPTGASEAKLNITADIWKRIGVQANPFIVAPQRTADREYRSLHPGWEFTSTTYVFFDTSRLHTSDIGTAANRYAGGNKGAYSNPQMDALIDRLAVTIPADQRTAISAEMLRLGLAELPVLPLYWEVGVTTVAKKVKNVLPPNIRQQHGWNLPDWDVE